MDFIWSSFQIIRIGPACLWVMRLPQVLVCPHNRWVIGLEALKQHMVSVQGRNKCSYDKQGRGRLTHHRQKSSSLRKVIIISDV